ncbi:Sulfur carrier protein ThiS (thiamine biosynthesis) [Desulfacinum hydrothermale DSM 13146]|uniref:Sulfur carrier protein ThiS (Thiamine biosynthesis) n=1 Tax=Desulfacinum hydrothermale DSM 13146 TaxID=1121390 RepID=A0A1W1XDN2_9BACT|nr:MoaD/ThiS family protein [Desulfacinum hydrothermale]SMC21611.1 Sulfur carrier protein ThiS (thiamine biosynthesis) [Desulfacinum hydrothermale DSM 13146]
MALQVLLSATLRRCVPDYDPEAGIRVEVEPGTSVREVIRQLGLPEKEIKLIMINGLASSPEAVLQGNERVAFFPPVGGG